jgi:ferric-dicitrate binding protein FerR (iron transport regulator)
MNKNEQHSINIELITKFLSEEASFPEKEELENWRALSDENEKEFQSIKKLWTLSYLKTKQGLIDIDAEWAVQESLIAPKRKILAFRNIITIAASIILLFTLSIFGYRLTRPETIKTSAAEIVKQELPDGSFVDLNAKSKIKYSKQFGEKNRKLKLEGEAFFDVSENKELPFKIETDIAFIEVVGTQFNVNAYKEKQEVTVSVTEGTVWLYAKQNTRDTITVKAGETGIFKLGNKTPEKIEEIDFNNLGWKTKTFDFDDATLATVCAKLSNAYHVDFELNPKVENCNITVFFDQQELGPVLEVLKSTLDLQIGKKGEKIYITGNGCN